MTHVFDQKALIELLAAHLGVDPSKLTLLSYCPIRGPHGPCYGVAVKESA